MKIGYSLLFALILCSFLAAQTQQKLSRPESFEWDHQLRLWDEAYDNHNFAEAEGYARRSLEIVGQLGLSDVERATSVASLAEALRCQNKYSEAEPLFRQALAIRERELPAIHFRTALALQGLAETLVGLHRPGEAEPYFLRAIAIWDRIGEDDYNSCHHGAVLDGLGRIYLGSREYEKAEPVLTRALSVWIKGREKCSRIVTVVNDLANLYWAQGKLDRCETMYQQILPLLKQELGDERPEIVADEQSRLAALYMAEKKPAEALALLRQLTPVLQSAGASKRDALVGALQMEISALHELHSDAEIPAVQGQIDAIKNIQAESADPRVRWGAWMEKARTTADLTQRLDYLQKALNEAQTLGAGEELSQTLEMIAGAYTGNKNDLAESYLQRAMAVNEKVYGLGSSQVAQDLNSMAMFSFLKHKNDDAETYLQRALAIMEKIKAPTVLYFSIVQNLGDLYDKQQKYSEAEAAFLKSLKIVEAAPAGSEFLVPGPVERLGRFYADRGQLEKAVEYYVRLVKLKESQPAPDIDLPWELKTLSELLRKLNRADEAQVYDAQRQQIEQQISKTASVTK